MFSFNLTSEQRLARDMARKFCQREIEPLAEDMEEGKVLPYPVMKKFLTEVHGANEIETPRDWAEHMRGRDFVSRALIAVETARVSQGFTLSIGASLELAGFAISFAGTPEQIERWGIPIIRGDKIGCWGLTEPEAGSDVQGMKTTAKPDGDGWVLNGSKTFITNAPYADTMVIYAKAPGGVSAFVVERGMEGLTTSTPFDKMGHRASPTGAIYLDNVKVGKDRLLGQEGQGFLYILNNLNHERGHTPCLGIGIMERCIEEAVKFAHERVQFGKPIIKFQGIQFMFASMWTKLMATYSMLFTLAQMEDFGLDISAMAAAAKVYSTESATSVALDAIQIMGGYGYMREYKVERFMRDAKLMEIGAGTNQIQSILLARQLDKMNPIELSPLFAGKSMFPKEPKWVAEVLGEK